MRYLITFLLLIAVVLNGLAGYRLFANSEYDLSHLLVAASFAGIVFSIYLLTVGRKQQRIG